MQPETNPSGSLDRRRAQKGKVACPRLRPAAGVDFGGRLPALTVPESGAAALRSGCGPFRAAGELSPCDLFSKVDVPGWL